MNASVDRANIFKNYIDYDFVQEKVFLYLIDPELIFSKTANEEDYLELIGNSYPDTFRPIFVLWYN